MFTLTLDGRAKQWCYPLPIDFILSFKQLVNTFHRVFDKYEYQDVLNEIYQLRIVPNEYLEHFID